MRNVLNVIPHVVVVSVIQCPVPGCGASFQPARPMPANTPYVCRTHSPFTASKCWATDPDKLG
jgi:hypothetical protein